MRRPPPTSTPFPYTTLFRSHSVAMPEIQERRENKRVPGGRMLHEYANMYFDAHNPMLSKCRHRRSEEHTSELQSLTNLVCRLLLEKKNNTKKTRNNTIDTQS